uniref:Protein containing Abdominal-A domain n=1 Tax=Rhipicephalus zambeziensis TaxID=60191 RepID=A0A224YZJ4_9ACAR
MKLKKELRAVKEINEQARLEAKHSGKQTPSSGGADTALPQSSSSSSATSTRTSGRCASEGAPRTELADSDDSDKDDDDVILNPDEPYDDLDTQEAPSTPQRPVPLALGVVDVKGAPSSSASCGALPRA